MNSKRERLVKEILEEQIRDPWKGCWVESLRGILEKYELSLREVIKLKREKLKERVEKKVEEFLEVKLNEKKTTKLRFIGYVIYVRQGKIQLNI